VQAASDTLSPADRQSIALEISSLRDQMLSLANTQDTNGNYLFSGSRVGSPAFSKDAKGLVVYQGDESRMKVAVGDNRRMNLNMPGADAFVKVVRDDGKGHKTGVGFFQAIHQRGTGRQHARLCLRGQCVHRRGCGAMVARRLACF
jgi:flagellar hook-associated protein 3 FlgL